MAPLDRGLANSAPGTPRICRISRGMSEPIPENPFDDEIISPAEADIPTDPAPDRPRAKRSSAGRKRNPVDRALARRVIEKFQALTSASPSQREALGVMLDVAPDNVVEMTCRALEGARDASRALDDIRSLRNMEPVARGAEATVMVMQHRDRVRAAWMLLVPIAGLPKDLPAHPSKAGIAFAEAVSRLSDEQLVDLSAPLGFID